MICQPSFPRKRFCLGIALCSLLSPALLSASAPAGMAGAETTQLLDHEQSPTTGNNGSVTVDQSSPGITSPLQQDKPHWRLRFNLSFVDPMGDSVSSSIGHGTIKFGMGAGAGAGLQAEYRATPRLGVEVGIMGASQFNVSNNISRGSIRGDVSLTGFAPLSLGLNFHLTPERKFDFYAGPQIALVNYGTDRIWWGMSSSGARVSLDNDWAWGLVAGLDLPMGKRGWLFNANLRYLDTSIKQSRGDFHFDREFDPLILSVGVGYAF